MIPLKQKGRTAHTDLSFSPAPVTGAVALAFPLLLLMLILIVGIFVGVLVRMDMDMDMFIPGIFGTTVLGSIDGEGVGLGVGVEVVLGVEGVEMDGLWGEEMRGVVVDTVFVR
jgi:hypothetical protein